MRQFNPRSRGILTNLFTWMSISSSIVDGAHVFDKNFVGVVFSPYAKNRNGSTYPPWDTYTENEVATMIQLVSTKFRNISTFGMGTTSANTNWTTGDSVGFTGVEAAKLNARLKSTAISVSLGIWQHGFQSWIDNAINTAFDVTQEANRIYPGTVWGITLTSNYVENSDLAGRVSSMVDFARNMSDDNESYIEKINEPELEVCQPKVTTTERIPDRHSEGNEGINSAFLVGGGIGILVLSGSLVAIVLLYFKLQKAKGEKLTEEEIAEFEQGLVLNEEEGENFEIALRLPYDRKFELEKTQFKIDKQAVLGSGAFGIVYKGKIDGRDEDVAFKTTKPSCPVENLKSLLSEIKLMIYIGQHENVVGLVAAYTGELRDGEVYIASEFCSLGSLENFLRASQDRYVNVVLKIEDKKSVFQNHDERYANCPRIVAQNVDTKSIPSVVLSLKSFVKWSYQIANGMDYLSSKKVIHADLATRNVLLNGEGIAKITDFGLSRKMYAYTNYVKKKEEPLPWRWMSIESLKQLKFSTQSDVWSYGITLWEIYSLGDVPYPGLGWNMDFVETLSQGLRLKQPSEATPEIFTEMAKCWIKNPDQRPTFRELANFFLQLNRRYEEVEYLNLTCLV